MSDTIGSKCLLCGGELIHKPRLMRCRCDICFGKYITDIECVNGHHVCRDCALKEYYKTVKAVCMKSKSRNPIVIAEKIMAETMFQILGKRHYLTADEIRPINNSSISSCKYYIIAPVALFTAYKNCGGIVDDFEKSLDMIIENVLLGHISLCRAGGICGVPIVAGRAMKATAPNSDYLYKSANISNKFSSECIDEVLSPEYIGPLDCCRRNVYISIFTGVRFIKEYMNVCLSLPDILVCRDSADNSVCGKERCQLFCGKSMMKFM